MIVRFYTPKNSKSKKELLDYLRECWSKSTPEGGLHLSNLHYEALNGLYTKCRKNPEDFMKILLMTMRARGGLDREHKANEFLSGPALKGLRGLLKHWRKQQNKGSELDIVCEFIGSRHELRRPEYIVGALVEQVRRIRRGWKPGKSTHLEISDGLLALAKKAVDQISGGSEGQYNVVPNKHLRLLVEFQQLLNLGKRPISAQGLNPKLKEFEIELDKCDDFSTKDIYLWWTYFSLVRNSRRCMMPDVARRYDKGLEKVVSKMSEERKKWAKDAGSKTKLEGIGEEMAPLKEYHKEIADFLNRGSSDTGRRDLKLYSTIVGPEGTRKSGGHNLFVNLDKEAVTKPPKGSFLIRRLDISIANADLASQSVISRGHLLAPVMLVLLATDLVIRFRWFLAPTQAAVYEKRYKDKRITLHDNYEQADRLKKELIGVLENIKIRLELVLPPNPTPPIQLIEGWITYLTELEIEGTRGRFLVDRTIKLTALGQLSDACGKLVNWRWSKAWRSEVVPRTRSTDDPQNLELYLPQRDVNEEGTVNWNFPDKPLVLVSLDPEGEYRNHYPYLKPVLGESSR